VELGCFSKPLVQSKIVGILWMVPIYSFDSGRVRVRCTHLGRMLLGRLQVLVYLAFCAVTGAFWTVPRSATTGLPLTGQSQHQVRTMPSSLLDCGMLV
jgi:hypothetical protein